MENRVSINAYTEEINELIAQMTIDEKLNQLDEDFADVDWDKVPEPDRSYCKEHLATRTGDARTYNILQRYACTHTRLKIPYLIHEEGLHGLYRPDTTIFPQQMTLGCTFDPTLAKRMGEGIAAESRAKGIHEIWAPVLDLARDPRWGRTEETYGEDTYLCSKMGAGVVEGMQGGSADTLKSDSHVLSELKHFAAYGAPTGGLNCAPTAMGRHEAFAYCLPVFEEAVKSGAFNAMASYNSIDGRPVISDHEMLTDILRDKWGMPGLVRADMTAINMQRTAHHTAATSEESLKNSVKAGVDVQLYDYSHDEYRRLMKVLLEKGDITTADLDKSVERVLRCKFAVGLFDSPYTDEALEEKRIRCDVHRATALEIAQKGAVLLKNQKDILPLSNKYKKVAVLGPNASCAVLGDYHVEPNTPAVTLIEGIQAIIGSNTELLIEKGCNILGSGIRPVERWWVRTSPRPDFNISEEDYGFTAEYFNGANFSSKPVVTRIDPQINFNWIMQKPDEAVDSRQFCVRWTGTIKLESTFNGRLGLSSPDSMRLYINDELIVDGWEEKDANQMIPYTIERGKDYNVKVEFRNDARAARVVFGLDSGAEEIEKAVSIARQADVAIVALGDSAETSGENFDRTSLDLPGDQLNFLKAIYETGTPVVLVIYTGRPVSCSWEQEHVRAILQAGFNGEMGGQAVAEILFGKVNPSGRLSMSYPKTVGQIPCHYARKPAGGLKYVEMDWKPLYPFGYGLSYTSFEYSDLVLSAKEISADGTINVSCTVTNDGHYFGEEVVQLYINDRFTSVVTPMLELKGFSRIALNSGESKIVNFTLGFNELKLLNANFEWVVESGEFDVMVGKNAEDIILRDRFIVK